MLFERHIRLSGTCNLRDLGGYPVADGRSTRWRQLLRSDSLHALDADGMRELLVGGLVSVIDLRSVNEVAAQPNPFRVHHTVSYTHIPLFADLDLERHLGQLASTGDVLLALYCSVLSDRQFALCEALSAIVHAEAGTVLFHCTVGKDRTGILAALLLSACGVSPEVIVSDYALSSDYIGSICEKFLSEFSARGANTERLLPLLQADPATMRGMLAYLTQQYGGVDAYWQQLDPDHNLREKLCHRMLSP